MDAKITKERLNNYLSYEWLKIIAVATLVAFAWVVVLSSVGTQPTKGQKFTLMIYYDVQSNQTALDSWEDGLLTKNVFSYEVQKTQIARIDSSYYADISVSARFAVADVDATVISDLVFYEDGCINYCQHESAPQNDSYLVNYVNYYYDQTVRVDTYMERCEEYLNTFYNGDYEQGELNEEYLEEYFRTVRIVKDKRYKNEESIASGLVSERTRIEKLRNDYIAFCGYLEEELISLKYVTITDDSDVTVDGGGQKQEGTFAYAIDLSRLTKLSEMFYMDYSVNDTEYKKQTTGLSLVIHDWPTYQYDLQFEQISFVNYLVEEYNNKI